MKPLLADASILGVELIIYDVRTPEDVMTAIQTLPQDAVIFFIPSPSIESGRDAMFKAAAERGIAIGSYTPGHVEAGALVSYAGKFFSLPVSR